MTKILIDRAVVERLISAFDSEIHNEYDGTSMLEKRLSEIDFARTALAQQDHIPDAGKMVSLELSDAEIDAAWRSVDYTQPYDAFRIAVARAILRKAGKK